MTNRVFIPLSVSSAGPQHLQCSDGQFLWQLSMHPLQLPSCEFDITFRNPHSEGITLGDKIWTMPLCCTPACSFQHKQCLKININTLNKNVYFHFISQITSTNLIPFTYIIYSASFIAADTNKSTASYNNAQWHISQQQWECRASPFPRMSVFSVATWLH